MLSMTFKNNNADTCSGNLSTMTLDGLKTHNMSGNLGKRRYHCLFILKDLFVKIYCSTVVYGISTNYQVHTKCKVVVYNNTYLEN